ncbi:TPA: hypothetical protein WI183_000397 [Neisseria meningitidis]
MAARTVFRRPSNEKAPKGCRYLIFQVDFYSGLTKTSTALPRLSSKRTIL